MLLALLWLFFAASIQPAFAAKTLCAVDKIEIRQEQTLEHQALR